MLYLRETIANLIGAELPKPEVKIPTWREVANDDLREAQIERLNQAKLREEHDALEQVCINRIARLQTLMSEPDIDKAFSLVQRTG